METKISVILPVYNVEKYLREAVASVQRQTLGEIEIILVDDGSTDGSGSICDAIAREDARVRVIHQENGGLTAAWKQGVRQATGAYIGFVDSDDWVQEDMYERMFQAAKEQDADIVCCGIRHVFEDGGHADWDDEMQLPRDCYTQEELAEEVFPILLNNGSFMGRGMQPNRVSKLIRRELVLEGMQLCDEQVSVGEDLQFSFSIFTLAKKIVILPHYLPYFYRVNGASMTGGSDPAYLGKIKYLKSQLERIDRERAVFSFGTQITNDFLCLAVLHIKREIVQNREKSYGTVRKSMKRICTDLEVRQALAEYRMPGLTQAEKLFLSWMKRHWYLPIYLAVRIYFRKDQL